MRFFLAFVRYRALEHSIFNTHLSQQGLFHCSSSRRKPELKTTFFLKSFSCLFLVARQHKFTSLPFPQENYRVSPFPFFSYSHQGNNYFQTFTPQKILSAESFKTHPTQRVASTSFPREARLIYTQQPRLLPPIASPSPQSSLQAKPKVRMSFQAGLALWEA